MVFVSAMIYLIVNKYAIVETLFTRPCSARVSAPARDTGP